MLSSFNKLLPASEFLNTQLLLIVAIRNSKLLLYKIILLINLFKYDFKMQQNKMNFDTN